MKLVNRGIEHINIESSPRDLNEEDIQKVSEAIPHLGEAYNSIVTASIDAPINNLREAVELYDSIVKPILNKIEQLRKEANSTNPSFIFFPININLQQGNSWQPFDQLSFGQKSGIILRLLITGTASRILIIDQPEDNLDATAIDRLLAPSLNEFSEQRQVIIATHSSQLALSLKSPRFIVMQSNGETGQIKHSGYTNDRSIVNSLLDVLEGGVDTFNLKLKTFEDFVENLKRHVQDMDISLIESSFRRHTIDGLRNYLQPIITDEEILSMLRHELKQRHPLQIITPHLNAALDATKNFACSDPNFSDLTTRLELLYDKLIEHIQYFQSAIEDLRLMDIEPNPTKFNIYDLLNDIKTHCMNQIGSERKIDVSVSSDLKNISIFADQKHITLIIRNLLNNSLRATERRKWNLPKGVRCSYLEKIEITYEIAVDNTITLIFKDNGCGIAPDMLSKLYHVRCSDQPGRDHGLGGIIIKKLLEINNGDISIISSTSESDQAGTAQRINLPIADNEKKDYCR